MAQSETLNNKPTQLQRQSEIKYLSIGGKEIKPCTISKLKLEYCPS